MLLQSKSPCLLPRKFRLLKFACLYKTRNLEEEGIQGKTRLHRSLFSSEKFKLKQIVKPAIVASILAMILGSIPFTKKLIFTNGAPLFFFTDSCMILGTRKFKTRFQDNSGNYIWTVGVWCHQ
ncbi:unnamed protein product [Arabis nemorensis]|uniref:Uncharacterized protein n=1 Tax=Arabis nemorensis TaxID=586526 RepID=A0A565BGM7_9BRAS|nr:unnamed protein product [Arabis nemorensis]